jgi:hypothetical protein
VSICIFDGKPIAANEWPIPISVLEFQPPTGIENNSIDRFTAKYCCQECYRKIHENIAAASCSASERLMEAHK